MEGAILRALLGRGIDVRTAAGEHDRGLPDPEQLLRATNAGRVLVTANTRDFGRIGREMVNAGGHHAGIIIVLQGRFGVGEQIRLLATAANTLDPRDMRDRVEFLKPETET